MKILVSMCLLGVPCRYDGKACPNEAVIALSKEHTLIPVCPEQLGGLCTPRMPAERRGKGVVTKDGQDVTQAYRAGAEQALALCRQLGCTLAVLKERSPSCGRGHVYDGAFSGTLTEGDGVTAALLMKNGIPVLGESAVERGLNLACPCRRLSCARFGDCAACRAYHESHKKGGTPCDRK